MAQLALKSETNLDILKNPFATKNVTRIRLCYEKKMLVGKWTWIGCVYFRNGNTSGDQSFEHENFDIIVKQINDFIASLGDPE